MTISKSRKQHSLEEKSREHDENDGSSSLPDGSNEQQAGDAINTEDKAKKSILGVHGVRLKQFESVMANVLPKVQPYYVDLPPQEQRQQHHTQSSPSWIPSSKAYNDDNEYDWPFTFLPTTARVYGNNPGQLKHPKRAWRKEGQLRSMLRCILPLIPDRSRNEQQQHQDADNILTKDGVTIVDFGGGSGHLATPLALMLPTCRVIVVDFNKRSLELMHEKASLVSQEIMAIEKPDCGSRFSSSSNNSASHHRVDKNPSLLRPCCDYNNDGILNNLYTFHGSVEQFTEPFDVALALHLCGEATDVALRTAASVHAAAIIVAPCCVGKLSQKVLNPDIYNATGQNVPTVSYPQSSLFCQLITEQDDWDALAKAADYSNEQECGTSRNATRRTAKALLETDRRLFLEEQYGYSTALLRMQPLDVTPKNDILVAWIPTAYGEHRAIKLHDMFSTPNADCQADVEMAKSHLVLVEPSNHSSSYNNNDGGDNDGWEPMFERNDWTVDEEREVRTTITDFLDRTQYAEDSMDQIFVFPTKMGGRKRKLIHYVAGQLNLAHWSQGYRDNEKTVVVARRGQQKRQELSAGDS